MTRGGGALRATALQAAGQEMDRGTGGARHIVCGKSGKPKSRIGRSGENRATVIRVPPLRGAHNLPATTRAASAARQGQRCIRSSNGVVAMDEKKIHPKTAAREAKSDVKKEERVGSVMAGINEQLSLFESFNSPWPPRGSSPPFTMPCSREVYQPPDFQAMMQLTLWMTILDKLILTDPENHSWYAAARNRCGK